MITDDLAMVAEWKSYLKILYYIEYLNIGPMSLYLSYKQLFIFVIVSIFILTSLYFGKKINEKLSTSIDKRQQSNYKINDMFIDSIDNANNIM